MEISFHVPNSNTQFVGDENRPSAQVIIFPESHMLGSLSDIRILGMCPLCRYSEIRLSQWQMLEQEVKKLLLLLMGLPFLLLGRLCQFLTKLMLAYALNKEK